MYTFTAINGYYAPEGFPSISVGFETGEDGSVTTSSDGLESFFVGLTFDEVGPGSAGIAMGTKTPTCRCFCTHSNTSRTWSYFVKS